MNRDGKAVEPGYRLGFSDHEAGLRAHLTGHGALPEVRAYWLELAAEARNRSASALLLIDELAGESLTAEQWQAVVAGMQGQGLERLKIAHVKPSGIAQEEYCEIYSREAGLEARVFEHEHEASLWLRYGER